MARFPAIPFLYIIATFSDSKIMSTIIHIKNMVCPRCIRVVREEFQKLGLHINRIELGEVEIEEIPDNDLREKVKAVLEENGFELIESQKVKIIENIKKAIIDLIYNEPENTSKRTPLSRYLARKIGFDYSYLSTLFSSIENVTIEKYFIHQRIERVKELLRYEEHTLSEIAYRLNYSSVHHLSAQFKQITGFSPSEFRRMVGLPRKPIDKPV
jgi:AraC family transcriptional regulator